MKKKTWNLHDYKYSNDATFGSIMDAARYYHIDNSTIAKCCKGYNKYAGTYNGEKLLWEYVN